MSPLTSKKNRKLNEIFFIYKRAISGIFHGVTDRWFYSHCCIEEFLVFDSRANSSKRTALPRSLPLPTTANCERHKHQLPTNTDLASLHSFQSRPKTRRLYKYLKPIWSHRRWYPEVDQWKPEITWRLSKKRSLHRFQWIMESFFFWSRMGR